MTEVGNLRVNLGLDSAQFDRSITSLNRQLQTVGQEFRTLQNKGKDWGNSLEGLRSKQTKLTEMFTVQQEKVNRLSAAYEKAKAEQGEYSAEAQKLGLQLARAQAEMQKTETELGQVTSELERQEAALVDNRSSWQKFQEAASQAATQVGEKMKVVGEKMTAVGKDLSMKLTAPIVAFGVAAAKVGSGFEAAMSEVAAISGATGEDLAALEAKAREMGATTKYSASEAADALKYMSLAGWDSEKSIAAIGGVLNLAAASGMDLAAASDLVTDYMSAFGIEAEKSGYFADVMAYAQKNANTSVVQLGDAFKNTAAVMNAGGQDVETTTAFLAMMANQGFKGAEAGTALTAIMRDMTAKMKDGAVQIGKTNIKVMDAQGNYRDLTDILKDVSVATDGMGDAERAMALSSTFTADSIKGLNLILNAGVDEAAKFEEGLRGSAGTAEKMAAVMNDNLQGRIKEMQSALEDVGITIYKNLQPALEKVVEFVSDLAAWFSELSPASQNMIMAFAAIAAAIGPLLVVGGVMVSSLGAIFTAFGTVTGAIATLTTGVAATTPAIGGLTAMFTALTGPIGIAIAAIAGIGIGAVVVGKEMNESSIQIEGWSNKVSDSTAKAVGSFMELSDQASGHLSTLSITGQTVTEEMASNITNAFSKMGQQVLSKMQSDHSEQLAALSSFYSNSNVLIESEEAEILARTAEYQANKEKQISEGNARIAEIMTTASNEKRALTLVEEFEISSIHAKMKDNAVKYLTESALEQQVIYEAIKNNASEMSALQAAEVVKNSVKQKDEVVKEAEEQYKKAVAEIIKQRDEMGVISAEQSKQLIEDAGKQRDETIKAAEDQHEKIVGEAKKQAEGHIEQVDWETGEVKSKWEIMKTDVSKKMKDLGSNIKKDWSDAYTNTKKSVADIFNSATGKIGEMKTSIETKMGEVKTKIETKWIEAKSFLDGINLIDTGKEIVNGLIKGIGDKFGDVKKKVEQLASNLPEWTRKILGIASPSKVFKQIGLWTGEGLAIGIDGSSAMVNKSMENIADGIMSVSEKFQKEYSNLIDDFNNKNENKEDKSLEKIQKIRDAAAKKKRALTQSELQKIAVLEAEYRDGKYKAERDFDKKYLALVKQSEKEYLEVIKTTIEEKKSLDQLSLLDEVEIWERSVELFNEGSKERLTAQKAYKTAVEAVNKELTSINKEYSDQIVKVNEDLIKSEETLNKAYDDAVNKRASSLVNFKGIFDEFKFEIGATGEELMSNLQSQVSAFEEWQRQIDMLSDKAINKGLLAELKEMGPNALPQLIQLNSMTDKQLTEYSNLYEKKSKLAREQAEKELKGMKDDTEKQIKAMQLTARTQLSVLNSEWAEKIRGLTKTTGDELSSLEKVGRDAGNGLLQGLSSTEGALQAKARQIADSISRTIKDALQIKSPSRVMMGFGENVGEGLIIGMDDKIKQIVNAGKRMASAVTQPMDDISIGRMTRVSSSSIDNSRSYRNGDTHIYVTGNNPSPSEIARRYTQAQRQQAMEWGVV